jgi:hypothetical protein
VSAARVLALLARWCGLRPVEVTGDVRGTLRRMIDRFSLDALPRDPVAFTADDDAWLRSGG